MESFRLDSLLDFLGAPVPEVVVYTQRVPRNVAAAIWLFEYVTPEVYTLFAIFGVVCVLLCCLAPLVWIACWLWWFLCCSCGSCTRPRRTLSVDHLDRGVESPRLRNVDLADEVCEPRALPKSTSSTPLMPLVAATSVGALPSPHHHPQLRDRTRRGTSRP